MQKYYVNAHITPTQSIVVKKEPVEIKQENLHESKNRSRDFHGGTSIQPNVVPIGGTTNIPPNVVPNDLQLKVDTLTAEKDKLIIDFLALKSENQRIFFNLQKREEILLQKETIEKELNSKYAFLQSENQSIVDKLKQKIVELQNSEKKYATTENDLRQQFAEAKHQLLPMNNERDEFKKAMDRLIKENNQYFMLGQIKFKLVRVPVEPIL